MTRQPVADGNRWSSLLGYVFFVGMLATGYYSNVTFVQLGLVHLGPERIGMADATVALNIAALALFAATVAIGFGVVMVRYQ